MHQAQSRPGASKWEREVQERAREFAAFIHMTDYQIYLDKQRREAARREAEARGLDGGEKRAAARAQARSPRQTRRSTIRLAPEKHAWALVRETQLSYREIAQITGLGQHEILHMKIQLLRAA